MTINYYPRLLHLTLRQRPKHTIKRRTCISRRIQLVLRYRLKYSTKHHPLDLFSPRMHLHLTRGWPQSPLSSSKVQHSHLCTRDSNNRHIPHMLMVMALRMVHLHLPPTVRLWHHRRLVIHILANSLKRLRPIWTPPKSSNRSHSHWKRLTICTSYASSLFAVIWWDIYIFSLRLMLILWKLKITIFILDSLDISYQVN